MYADLLEKLKAATGPDRNLDAMLHHRDLQGIGTGYYADAPRYTGSIDAALALVEKKLPGWVCTVCTKRIDNGHDERAWADMASEQWVKDLGAEYDAQYAEAYGATPSIAILIALVSALHSQGEAK
jgi:hypothetical protein